MVRGGHSTALLYGPIQPVVTTATRLDPLLRLRERTEERAQQALAEAIRGMQGAAANVEVKKHAASADHRTASSATEWLLAEETHLRARGDLKKAEAALEAARGKQDQSRAAAAVAQQSAEVVRRAADRKRAEHRAAEGRAERKQLDQIALLLRVG